MSERPKGVPQTVTAEQTATAQRLATPALFGAALLAGSVDQVVAEVRPLVAAGLRHVVVWNVGVLATGAEPTDVLRLVQLSGDSGSCRCRRAPRRDPGYGGGASATSTVTTVSASTPTARSARPSVSCQIASV